VFADRGVKVDHMPLFRRIQAYAPGPDKPARPHRRMTSGSWRVDETLYLIGVAGYPPQHEDGIARMKRKTEVCDVDSALAFTHIPAEIGWYQRSSHDG